MSFQDICDNPGCSNPATRVTASETKHLFVCTDCFNKKYRN